MEIALIGLPLSGKSTVFSMLTGEEKSRKHSGRFEYNISRVLIADDRLDNIYKLFPRDKKVNISVDFIDMVGIDSSSSGSKGLPEEYIHPVRNCDALLLVIQSPLLKGVSEEGKGSEILIKDLDSLESDLLISDLDVVEKRHQKLSREIQLGKLEQKKEFEILGRCLSHLNENKPLRFLTLSSEEEKIIKGYAFISQKPILVVLNIADDEIGSNRYHDFEIEAERRRLPLVKVCGKLEAELKELSEEERYEFMKGLGISILGKDLLIQASYKLLNLITFYTIGKDEVRAWSIKKGETALDGAGKIHSDIQRGFIRAEVVGYDDLIKYKTFPELKKTGKLRSEGKSYSINDGDIIEFKFNV